MLFKYVKSINFVSFFNSYKFKNDNISTNLVFSGNFVFASPPVFDVVTTGSNGYFSFTQEANDWYRVNITATSGITSGNTVRLYYGDTGNMIPLEKTLLVWGKQLEPGLTANPLVKTTSNPISKKQTQGKTKWH